MKNQEHQPEVLVGAFLPTLLLGGSLVSAVLYLLTTGTLRSILGILALLLLGAGLGVFVAIWTARKNG